MVRARTSLGHTQRDRGERQWRGSLRLAAIVANRNSPQKHVWRVRIILLTADGLGTAEIMRRTGKSKSVVWRWQERCMQGVDGLLRDKTRPSRKPPLDRALIARVVELTASAPSGEATHWTAAAMAKTTGISVSSVQRIWRSHGLQPHRVRQCFGAAHAAICGMAVEPRTR
jgi:transposase